MTRRGAHTGSGGKPPQSREVTVSRHLSSLLRHNAASQGVRLDEGGWANVAHVVGWIGFFFSFVLFGGEDCCDFCGFYGGF